jgi:hypothetical protein
MGRYAAGISGKIRFDDESYGQMIFWRLCVRQYCNVKIILLVEFLFHQLPNPNFLDLRRKKRSSYLHSGGILRSGWAKLTG